jgi:hypothetical protein
VQTGDLVKADDYLSYIGGQTGIVIEIQSAEHCVGAYVLFADSRVQLVRIENLRVINESR